jgi:hypothetical protein
MMIVERELTMRTQGDNNNWNDDDAVSDSGDDDTSDSSDVC